MKKKIDIGQTLTILANVGVLLGILLLVYELSLTRDLAKAQFEIDKDGAFQASELAIIGGDLAGAWEKSLFDPASLSVPEIRTLDAFYAIQINRWENTWDREQQGIEAAGRTREHILSDVQFYFGNRFAHLWWSYDRENWDPEFAVQVDGFLDDLDPAANRIWMDSIRADLAGMASPKSSQHESAPGSD